MHQFEWLSERGVGVTLLICFRKRGYPKRGVPSEKGGDSNPGGNYVMEWLICFSIVNLMLGCLLFKKFNESCSLSKAVRMSSTYCL